MRPALDLLLFVVLPYAATLVCVVGTIERYRRHAFSVTSLSSQLLENRRHFWSMMPFHLGILVVLAAHVLFFAFPSAVLRMNASMTRVIVAEAVTLAAGVSALVGLFAAGFRRAADGKLRLVTSAWDWLMYALLLGEIAIGVAVSVWYPWGSSWYAAVMTPYLWSLVQLNPDASAVAALPLIARAHVVAAFLLVGLFPFSRLVHILAVPNPYLWRAPQIVRWYARPANAVRMR